MSDPLPFESATPRFSLPMLFAGQAQKEFFVNEALLRTDLLLHGAVEEQVTAPPASRNPGQAWLVGAGATGTFAGHDDEIAAWTEGGWRFIAPVAGTRVFDLSLGAFRLFVSGTWRTPAAVAAPAGGATVDAEARATLAQIMAMLVGAGLIPAG
jgi:hypothetical protein